MDAQDFADSLCGAVSVTYALLRDEQRHVDVDHDARLGVIERQLSSLLHDLDRLADLAEQQALEELLDDLGEEANPPTGIANAPGD